MITTTERCFQDKDGAAARPLRGNMKFLRSTAIAGLHEVLMMGVVRVCVAALLVVGLGPYASAQAPPPLEILVLGSGGPGAAGRAASSYVVFVDGTARILVDAGPGSFARLGENKVPLANLDIVLLTHLHIDHAGELPGLFKARAVASSGPIAFDVWGPTGAKGGGPNAYFPSTSQFVQLLFGAKGAFAYLSDFAAPLSVRAHDLAAPVHNAAPQSIVKKGGLEITAIAGHHGDAPALIYRIDHAGKSVTFSGDIDADGLIALRRLASATDLLVFNCVVLDPPGSPAVLYTLHTPPRAIGPLAKDARVGALLLSHLSPSVEQAHDAVAATIRHSYGGTIDFAKDSQRIRP
jgi:ribonuclease BN (tRNA processing enzyme)